MKNFWFFFCILGVIFLSGCDSQPIPSYTPPITGDIVSRDVITENPLKNGSQVLFNATGGTTIDNKVFTLHEGVWLNEKGKEISINTASETTLTAIYPAYSGEALATHNPYIADTLQDILIAQGIFNGTTDIQLQFHHLFSQLTVHVHSSIASSVDAVELTCPKVTEINPHDGTFTHQGTHSTRQIKNNSKPYSFIVPSISNCPLTLTFTLNTGETRTHTLTQTFKGGHKYECHVNRPGIRNVADLIELSQFINDPKNKGKMHPEFGEAFGDSIVYRLLADLKFEPEDCERLAPIGSHEDTPFYDTFDGEGHTISKLILPDENTESKHSGLFGYIESGGIVQNLKIDNASTISAPTCTYIGIIASCNYGTINNCSVTNSEIHSKADGAVGLICAITTGAVVNCYSANDTIHITGNTYAGAISGSAEARITNCYASNNTFNVSGTGNHIGCIAGMTSNQNMLNIRNCYIYHTSNKSDWCAAIGQTQKASIRNFYYNKGELYGGKLGTTPQNVDTYDAKFQFNNTHISQLLNNWIDTTGKESYKEYTFNRWTIAPDGSPCFE